MVQLDALSAVVGGACIGLTAFYNFKMEGRVTGISGEAFRAVYTHSKRSILFLFGLTLTSFLLSTTIFSATSYGDAALAPSSIPRIAFGASLLGLGASLSNGCTSGHGVCGLVRSSNRSITAVGTFMSTAAVTATLLKSSLSVSSPPPLDHLRAKLPLSAYITITAFACAPGILGFIAKEVSSNKLLRSITRGLFYVSTGSLFSMGLTLSGMIHPAKTLGFLDLSGSSKWDASMALVFAGALPISYAGYRAVLNSGPYLELKSELPQNSVIDKKLLIGSTLFGIGWGIVGMCPGPAFAYFGANGGKKAAVALVSMITGILIGKSTFFTV